MRRVTGGTVGFKGVLPETDKKSGLEPFVAGMSLVRVMLVLPQQPALHAMQHASVWPARCT